MVAVLYALSEKNVPKQNSFLRHYLPGFITKSNELDIRYNSYYIAGMFDDHIYLGNVTSPLHLFVSNRMLTDTQHVQLDIKNRKKFKLTKALRLKIDSPYFYLADGKMPGLFRGKLGGDWKADRFMYDSVYFNQYEQISDSTFAIRTKSSINLEFELGVVTNDTPNIRLEPDLLQKQINGIFCVDGELNYSKALDRLVYTYRYRNEYIVYDTDLNLNYRGHTIDTFSRAQIKVAEISSNNSMSLGTRPNTFNALSRVSGNYLYIYSALLAKNDCLDVLEQSSIIDVYDLRNDTYKLSFRIPNFKEKKVSRFMVFDNKILIATHGRYLVTYNLNSSYLKETNLQ